MVQIILSETIRNLKRFKNCVLKCSLETVMKSFLSNNRNQLKHTWLKLENTLIMTFGKLFLIPTRIRNQRPPENSEFQTNSAVEYMPFQASHMRHDWLIKLVINPKFAQNWNKSPLPSCRQGL